MSSTVVTLGGKSFEVGTLSVGAMKRLVRHMKALNKVDATGELSEEAVEGAMHIVYESLKRMTPSVTIELIADEMNVGTAFDLVKTILRVSGLVGEAKPEATPAPQSETSTGTD